MYEYDLCRDRQSLRDLRPGGVRGSCTPSERSVTKSWTATFRGFTLALSLSHDAPISTRHSFLNAEMVYHFAKVFSCTLIHPCSEIIIVAASCEYLWE